MRIIVKNFIGGTPSKGVAPKIIILEISLNFGKIKDYRVLGFQNIPFNSLKLLEKIPSIHHFKEIYEKATPTEKKYFCLKSKKRKRAK